MANQCLHIHSVTLVTVQFLEILRRARPTCVKGLNSRGYRDWPPPCLVSSRYNLRVQARITSYFAYRFAVHDITINWRSRNVIYESRMAPLATVLLWLVVWLRYIFRTLFSPKYIHQQTRLYSFPSVSAE